MEMFERLTVALETQAQRVAAALKQVEAKTADANIEVQRRRDEASKMTRKRQRHVALPCEPRPRFMDPAEQTFDASALVVEQELQTTLRALTRVSSTTRNVRVAVGTAKAHGMALLDCSRLASAKEARNECCSDLIRMLGRVDLGGSNAEVVLGHLTLVELYQVGGVSRAFSASCRGGAAR
jgi:hypothetical protein